MKFQHRIKSSLGIKLAIPITVFGLILLIVVLGVEIYAGRAVAKKAHHEHADIIVNTLSIVAEIDASEQSLWRAVSKLSDSHDLQQLCLFSLGSSAGIESQFCAKLGENAFLGKL